MIKFIDDKAMANGMRDMSKTPLTDEEIAFVLNEIKRIGADEKKFVFNDEAHIASSTCYDFVDDLVYVTRNVFPDTKYGSTHPRDVMSVGAVLAHEYYGHRSYREEYYSDWLKGKDFHTTPLWQDECRASITAAKITPNLSEKEKSDLVMDAVYRAKEYGNLIEMDDFMKGVLYGYSSTEKNISFGITPIRYVSEASTIGESEVRTDNNGVSKMPKKTKHHNDYER